MVRLQLCIIIIIIMGMTKTASTPSEYITIQGVGSGLLVGGKGANVIMNNW